MQALADGSEQDHRRDTDRDTQPGKKAAHAISRKAGSGQTEQIVQKHDRHLLAKASTGSSRAARRAGITLNRMPVRNAVPNAASTAHHGAATGNEG